MTKRSKTVFFYACLKGTPKGAWHLLRVREGLVMKFVSENGARNNFVTGSLYNKIYNNSGVLNNGEVFAFLMEERRLLPIAPEPVQR
ncbi:MAG: hypothetical protein A2X28_04195 [Elusimicrobia bacterium GWA2_56_46]|nr:MAG: hypothetical protein A2X28_04195 [Elusimicrobia bacterium GWA2_56_46]OGR56077.1 MAG: hypothetical protein A2X39_07615 [Elusimicrobia bacterium GWC2_56_31]HBW22911.1 hypothetical protein [Elusimicrobiota bacterium]